MTVTSTRRAPPFYFFFIIFFVTERLTYGDHQLRRDRRHEWKASHTLHQPGAGTAGSRSPPRTGHPVQNSALGSATPARCEDHGTADGTHAEIGQPGTYQRRTSTSSLRGGCTMSPDRSPLGHTRTPNRQSYPDALATERDAQSARRAHTGWTIYVFTVVEATSTARGNGGRAA